MTERIPSVVLSKRAILTYVEVLALLVVSGIGFWLWAQPPEEGSRITNLLFFVYAPFTLLIFVAVRAAIELGQAFTSTGFMSQVDTLQKRLNAQDDLIRSITDYAPSAMSIFNNKNEYWFVNVSAAENLAVPTEAILGKTPVALLGADKGRKIERAIEQVRQSGSTHDVLSQSVDNAGRVRYIQTHYQPMPPMREFAGGVIARDENVTQIIVERERNENMLRQTIATLVAVVDRRDPYASGHSARVGMLSRAIAVEMQLSEREIEGAEIAGSLMNFGKVLVSRSILTKTEGLTQEELSRVREGILTSADILARIDFAAPVVPTLRQVLERFDGTGVPAGLKGDEILVMARIVAVANSFIALVSPRAYRPGVDAFIAADNLAQDSGTAFDGRVIAALQSYLFKNTDKLSKLTGAKAV